jgi:hypothetical protein
MKGTTENILTVGGVIQAKTFPYMPKRPQRSHEILPLSTFMKKVVLR